MIGAKPADWAEEVRAKTAAVMPVPADWTEVVVGRRRGAARPETKPATAEIAARRPRQEARAKA